MEQTKYDVFISYSRKDYVDEQKNVIPGNPITAIQKLFDENGISYWFDKDGIYSCEEFVWKISRTIAAWKISRAITASKMIVFISSENSNVSEYTCVEILKAKKANKKIIPFRIDECDYNPNFDMLLLPLNHIDYMAQPNTALPKLLLTVKKEKERIEKIEADSIIEAAKEKIKEKAKEYLALEGQQDYILKELYSKNKLIGNTIKRCPVCEKEEPIQSKFCSQCGWHFPKLYGIDGDYVPLYDETQFIIARKCWEDLVRGINDLHSLTEDFENQKLKWNEEKEELTKSFSDLREEMENSIMSKEEVILSKEKEYEEIEAKYQIIVSDLNEHISSLNSKVYEAEKKNKELMFQNSKLQEKCNILEVELNDEKQNKSETSSKEGKKNVEKQKDTYTAKSVIVKSSKSIQSVDEAFSVIESCCDRKPIQDDFVFNKAKLSIDRLRPLLEKKYNIRITNSSIVACKDIGELKHLIYKCGAVTYQYQEKNNWFWQPYLWGDRYDTEYSIREVEYFEVYSSIFTSAEIKRKSRLLVQVYLHLFEETEKVKALSQEAQKDAERRDYIPLQCKLKKGDKVDVRLNIYGETLLMSDKKTVVWQGSFTKCSFDYFVPRDIDVDELSCVALLTVNEIPVGEMRFITKIVESPRKLNPEIIAHKYNKVFISYAHKDEAKVKSFHEGLKLAGIEHFFDRTYLKTGDIFPQVIRDYINAADLFVLFWSENASKSEYVQKERLQALERAFPQVKPQQAAKLSIYPMSIEPRAELPSDMKDNYHFGEI